jgi:hypothetical protein
VSPVSRNTNVDFAHQPCNEPSDTPRDIAQLVAELIETLRLKEFIELSTTLPLEKFTSEQISQCLSE